MRIGYKNYKIDTNKNVNITIAHIADIHFAKNYKLKRLEMLKQELEKIKPNYICITGDLIDMYNVVFESNFVYFQNWLRDLSGISKVIISIGNHEYLYKVENGYKFQKNISWLRKLQSKNLILLDNEIYKDGNVSFVGFNPSIDYYYNHEIKVPKRDNLDLYKLINKLSDGYNILLVHTPFLVFQDDNYKLIKDFHKFDLVLCGHTHGGMMPLFVPGNFGIISPSKKFFPRDVRGIKVLNNTSVVISSGVTRLSRKSRLTLLTDIYGVNINKIHIKIKKNSK